MNTINKDKFTVNPLLPVSVVVPTFESVGTLEKCLSSIRANRSKYSYEIIVADAGSQDDTLKIAGKYADKVLNGIPRRINRNIGVAHARGDIICFTDSDCTVPENWIQGLVDGLLRLNNADSSVAGIGSGNITAENSTLQEQAIAAAMRSPLISFKARNTAVYDTECRVTHNPPMNSACFKRVIEEVGGFREEPGYPEDLDLDAKILERGYKLYYLPGLLVYHKHKTNYKKFARQMRDFGGKRVRVNRNHKSIARFYHYGPLILCLMLYSPLFFLPLFMALANAVYVSVKEKTTSLILPLIRLTLSFYRSYGLGELNAIMGKTA